MCMYTHSHSPHTHIVLWKYLSLAHSTQVRQLTTSYTFRSSRSEKFLHFPQKITHWKYVLKEENAGTFWVNYLWNVLQDLDVCSWQHAPNVKTNIEAARQTPQGRTMEWCYRKKIGSFNRGTYAPSFNVRTLSHGQLMFGEIYSENNIVY